MGNAMGLAFSVHKGKKIPISLKNVFKCLVEDCTDLKTPFEMPKHGDLTAWAQQGVLLLNSTLTVEKGHSNSHKHIKWCNFTNHLIQKLNDTREHIVFMLWGSDAQRKREMIDRDKHLIVHARHPSGISAHTKDGKTGLTFFETKSFEQAEKYMLQHGIEIIDWNLEQWDGDVEDDTHEEEERDKSESE